MPESIDEVFRDFNTPGVPASGDYLPVRSRIRQLLKEIAGGTAAVGDFRGSWDSGEDYIAHDIVEDGGSLWYALTDSTNVTPTEGADWTVFLPGVSVADGAVTGPKIAASAVTEPKLADSLALQLTVSVASRTALKALSTTRYAVVFLTEAGREGQFIWRAADYSAQVTADTQEGLYVKATAIAASAGAWVRQFTGMPSVKWFGALGDNSHADLPNLQAATDLCDAVYVPIGTYKTSGPWLLDDYAQLHFESREAVIKSTSASAILRARGLTSTRNYQIQLHGGRIEGSGPAGPVGLDFTSATMCKVFGTWFYQVSEGVRQGGSGSLGAFYNDFFGVDMTDVTIGFNNGTLANSNNAFGGRIGSCVVGTDDNDNTCNSYWGLAIEGFTNSGHRVSNSGATVQRARFISSRLENVGGVGTGIKIAAAAESTVIIGEFATGLATTIDDGGTGTDHLASY